MRTQPPALRVVVSVVALALILSGAPSRAAADARPSECENFQVCYDLGVLTYVYAYPLVIMGVSAKVAANTQNATATHGRAPVNQFSHNQLPDASYTDIVLPSLNTPYSNAILDLNKEPVVMHLPNFGSRYFLMQVLDFWTNVGGEDSACLQGGTGFCGLGTRYGTQEGNYAFVGPNWSGTLPAGIRQVVTMPTNNVLIAGRILTTGSPEDLQAVRGLQAQMTLTPLGKFGKNYAPPSHAPVDPAVDMVTIPRDQVTHMDAATYYGVFAEWMKNDPPLPGETAVVAAMAKFGIVPGQPFNINRLDPATRVALEESYATARDLVIHESASLNLTPTNWSMSLDLGAWGKQYLKRAAVAYGALAANLYADAVYAAALTVLDGGNLNGANRYRIHFGAGELPPSSPNAFWSITLYNRDKGNLYNAPLGHNALGVPAVQNHAVCFNADGSLDFYISSDPPSAGPTSTEICNWIQSPPNKDFVLLMRIYSPTEALFRHINPWVPPVVERVG